MSSKRISRSRSSIDHGRDNNKTAERFLASSMCTTNPSDKNNYADLVKNLEDKLNQIAPQLTMQNFRESLLDVCNLTEADDRKQKKILKNVLKNIKIREKLYHSVSRALSDNQEYKDKIKNMEKVSYFITLFLNSTENPIHKKKGGKWSAKYKKSIDCNHPKGFSQKQHCKYGRKTRKNKN